jgi:hypothetical protein
VVTRHDRAFDMATARLRRLSEHVLLALPAASDMEPVRAGGENGIPFERWKIGQRFYTSRRTISDSDISTFVQLTGFQVRAFSSVPSERVRIASADCDQALLTRGVSVAGRESVC